MKFTKLDKEHLLRCYNGDEKSLAADMPQIEEAAGVTTYSHYTGDGFSKRVSRAAAIKLLGRERWLRGLVRSAFHLSAAREVLGDDAAGDMVFFDSAKLFK